MREGLMDDVGYHGLDIECPEIATEECKNCCWWIDREERCEWEVKNEEGEEE